MRGFSGPVGTLPKQVACEEIASNSSANLFVVKFYHRISVYYATLYKTNQYLKPFDDVKTAYTCVLCDRQPSSSP